MNNKIRGSGFTFVEMMVVVTVMGILTAISINSMSAWMGVSRNIRRRSDLQRMQNALSTYYTRNGVYPSTGGSFYSSEPPPGNNAATPNGPSDNGDWIPGLAPTFIAKLPRDPKGGSGNVRLNATCANYKSAYYYRSDDGTSYKLTAGCSLEKAPTAGDTLFDPVRPTWAWMVCSGPPACNTY